MTTDAPLEQLKKVGFRRVGEWTLDAETLSCVLEDVSSSRNVLYAFVEGETVLYIGKSVRSLKQRLSGYKRPGSSQRTNLKANSRIRAALGAERRIEVYAFADPGQLTHAGFRINLAAGLEDSLIDALKPAWNKAGV